MLGEEVKNIIRQSVAELAESLPTFRMRATQNKMIAEVTKTLSGSESKKLLVIEAPTGTGKTFAYLIPSIILAKQLGLKLIVSSSNVALQEQLEAKDLVELSKYTSLDFSFGLVKGRSRYVCVRDLVRVTQSDTEANPLFAGVTFNTPVDVDDINYLSTLLTEFELKRWDGEFDSLPRPLNSSLWHKISCNRFSCSGSKCEFYEECVFFKQRKKIHNLDVIIANHDLILADIASGNNILPKLEESIIIFDEAHHLPQKSLSHFDYELSLEALTNLCKQLENTAQKIAQLTEHTTEITTFAIKDALQTLTQYIPQLSFAEEMHIFDNGVLDVELSIMAKNLLIGVASASQQFENMYSTWQDYLQIHSVDNAIKEQLEEVISNSSMQLENAVHTLENWTVQDENIPQARWISKQSIGKNKTNYHIHSAKISVADELHTILFSKVRAAVLTSATLSSLGSFARLNEQLGISEEESNYFRLPSPFNTEQATFTIARMQYSPKAEEHTSEVAEQIIKRVDALESGGVLVLFASNYQMQQVADKVEKHIPVLLMQGNMSKQQILQQHIQHIDNGKKSVIFGLDSFAEGVDLKGIYLKLVIIAKLRFAVPSTPLEKTTNQYLESIGKNPFMVAALPDAGLKLIQACGRLLRTENDSGEIVVLDNRLTTTRWGRVLLESLPEYHRNIE